MNDKQKKLEIEVKEWISHNPYEAIKTLVEVFQSRDMENVFLKQLVIEIFGTVGNIIIDDKKQAVTSNIKQNQLNELSEFMTTTQKITKFFKPEFFDKIKNKLNTPN